MKRYLFAGAMSLGLFATTSAADPVADVQLILSENIQPASVALIEGLADSGVTLIETESAVASSAAFGNAVVATGSALVAGTEQFEALGLGLALGNFSLQGNLNPFLAAMDDPSAENINAAFNPDDLATIADNLPAAAEAGWEGSVFASHTGLRDAVSQGLQGNLVSDPNALIPGPSTLTSSLFGLTSGGEALFAGTNYDSSGANFAGSLGVMTLVVHGAASGQLEPAEEALQPVFEALEPVTVPTVAAIEAAEVPEIPEF